MPATILYNKRMIAQCAKQHAKSKVQYASNDSLQQKDDQEEAVVNVSFNPIHNHAPQHHH
jgi:hypothetical protein